ncbi:MAG: DUF4145 domain-containing protein [Gammaproteobacteria bacterium]|nr:DUF4145 domain-containing protein [Gammaproteobacteria bacterium]
MKFFDKDIMNWNRPQDLENHSWRCGYCSDQVSSTKGIKLGMRQDGSGSMVGGIYICTNCGGPTFISPDDGVYPGVSFGNHVSHVPSNLNKLYEEARRASSQNCFTAAVLLCRKILMNIAVELGAPEGKSFISYVNYLAEKNYIPPNGRHWVDHIRQKGNEANHEVHLMSQNDAEELVRFTEMLLKLVFEFPNLVPIPDTP